MNENKFLLVIKIFTTWTVYACFLKECYYESFLTNAVIIVIIAFLIDLYTIFRK